MTYKNFLKNCKIRPDISSAQRAHEHIFEELKCGPLTDKQIRAIKSYLMSSWCRWSSMAIKYHRPLAQWIIEDCVKAYSKL